MPETAGVDFYGDYILAIPPLAIVYTISAADCIVQVIGVYHQGGLGEPELFKLRNRRFRQLLFPDDGRANLRRNRHRARSAIRAGGGPQ